MTPWTARIDPERLREASRDSLVSHLGIRLLADAENQLMAEMPVDARTRQPMGLLHGGASVALAETLGSFASFLCIDPSRQSCVGLAINANHIRPVREGVVTGRVNAIHLGRSTHVWEIRITDDQDRLVCISRLTVAVRDLPRAESD